MNEIEKLYENAGINKSCHANMKFDDCIYSPSDCGYYNYPEFTAEKQLAILQLLTQQCDLTISHFAKWEFIHFDGEEPLQITGKDFTETFAKLINAYWQDLTSEKKEQIRGILNG